jgi:hypothetical protein
MFEYCAFVNNKQDKCIECRDGYQLAIRPNNYYFCTGKQGWQNTIAFDIIWRVCSGLGILYGLHLLYRAQKKENIEKRAMKEKEDSLERKFSIMTSKRDIRVNETLKKTVRYQLKEYTRMEKFKQMATMHKPPLKIPD